MEYSAVKKAVQTCPELCGLDGRTLADLFWMAREKRFAPRMVLYKQGDQLDGTFYLLLGGTLNVLIDGEYATEVAAPTLIGEGAFTTLDHKRMATLEVGADSATLLEFHPTEEMLEGVLGHLFSGLAWDRWLQCTRVGPA